MIGIVLVTHGRLAVEFRAALEHVVGPQVQIATIAIAPDDDMEMRRREILEKIAEVDSGQGVAVLTDMFGGTPSNLAISAMNGREVEVIAGINLPMLIKLASVRCEQAARRCGALRQGRRAQIYQCRERGPGRPLRMLAQVEAAFGRVHLRTQPSALRDLDGGDRSAIGPSSRDPPFDFTPAPWPRSSDVFRGIRLEDLPFMNELEIATTRRRRCRANS